MSSFTDNFSFPYDAPTSQNLNNYDIKATAKSSTSTNRRDRSKSNKSNHVSQYECGDLLKGVIGEENRSCNQPYSVEFGWGGEGGNNDRRNFARKSSSSSHNNNNNNNINNTSFSGRFAEEDDISLSSAQLYTKPKSKKTSL